MRSVWTVVVAALLFGCDKDASSGGAANASAPAVPASAAPAPTPSGPPAPPPLPTITLGEKSFTVDGQEVPWDKLEDRVQALGARKAETEGKDLSVVAVRSAPAHQVSLATSLLLAAWRPHSLTVRTVTRDQAQGELALTYRAPDAHAPECSAVVMIERDSGVALWSKAGGGAQKFARGMAGPDLTSSTEALRKRAATCDSPVWFLGTAESVTWGVAFDLATRARSDGDGGVPFRPKETVLLAHPPVAGRALKE